VGRALRRRHVRLVERFSESVSFDRRLYRQDIAASQAHARMLAKIGLLTQVEGERIVAGLNGILAEIEAGRFEWKRELEDVHMNIESRLTERIGAAGKKLHTGRSRNDQVATDIRLYVRDAIDHLSELIERLGDTLLDLAEREADTVMPGFTHMQIAQPVTFGHHMLAWREQLLRDRARLADARKRVNVLPLGSAALAGHGLSAGSQVRCRAARLRSRQREFAGRGERPRLRHRVLRGGGPDHAAPVALERGAGAVVVADVRLRQPADRFCTGSSIMPQKKIPTCPNSCAANPAASSAILTRCSC